MTEVLASFAFTDLVTQIQSNGTDLIDMILLYGSWILPLGFLLGYFFALQQKQKATTFLALATATQWLPIIVFAEEPNSRNYVAGLPLVVLLSVWGIYQLSIFLRKIIPGVWLGQRARIFSLASKSLFYILLKALEDYFEPFFTPVYRGFARLSPCIWGYE